jgi:hypothetical protein
MALLISDHARTRWAERFPERDIENEYAQAKQRVGKKTKRRIEASNPVAYPQWHKGGFKGRYFCMTRSRIVFVMAAPEIIVTVFQLPH